MATRRVGGSKWVVVAVLATAGVATGVWAATDGAGAGTDVAAVSQQQSQDQGSGQNQDQGPGQNQDQGPGNGNRAFGPGDHRGGFDRGGFDRGFDRGFGRRFGRDGGPGRGRHHWRRDWRRGHWGGGWGRRGWGPRGGFAGRGAGRGFGPGMRRGAGVGVMLDAPMLRTFRQLNLSDAQRQQVRTILMNALNSARQQRQNAAGAATARQDLAAIVNPGDPNYARAVQAAKDRAAQRIQRATQTQQALYNVLTPAQKRQLTQIFAQRRQRMQQRMQQRTQRAAQRGAGRGPQAGGADGQGNGGGQSGGAQ